VARSHVDALENPSAANQRILLISGLISPQLVVNIIRKNFPALASHVLEVSLIKSYLREFIILDGVCVCLKIIDDGTKEGKWEYIGLETSVVDTVESMIKNNVI